MSPPGPMDEFRLSIPCRKRQRLGTAAIRSRHGRSSIVRLPSHIHLSQQCCKFRTNSGPILRKSQRSALHLNYSFNSGYYFVAAKCANSQTFIAEAPSSNRLRGSRPHYADRQSRYKPAALLEAGIVPALNERAGTHRTDLDFPMEISFNALVQWNAALWNPPGPPSYASRTLMPSTDHWRWIIGTE